MILAVSLGAFGAHALKSLLNEHAIQTWKTATDYQFYHALGLIGLSLWSDKNQPDRFSRLSGFFLTLGTILFSGSLYLLAYTGNKWLGMITPIGGVSFLAGWLFWIIAVLNLDSATN